MTLKEKIIKLHKEGLPYNKIANELDCSKGTISYHLNPDVKEKAKKRLNVNRNKYRQALRNWVEEYRNGRGCKNCGEKHPATLHFHHREPEEKLFAISYGVNQHKYSKKILKEEMDKCDILCANCHSILHYNERNNS